MTSLVLSLGVASASAGDSAKAEKKDTAKTTQAPKKAATQNHVEKQVLLTGSYIKRDIRRNGLLTDGPNPVYVLDRSTIESSGASDLSQVLIRRGFHR
jgi:hypothetical protein